jgi:hypothetical protein
VSDCWTALGYSLGASKRKRKLCAQDISKTWWAGHETQLKKAAKHEYNQERTKKARTQIAAMQSAERERHISERAYPGA